MLLNDIKQYALNSAFASYVVRSEHKKLNVWSIKSKFVFDSFEHNSQRKHQLFNLKIGLEIPL